MPPLRNAVVLAAALAVGAPALAQAPAAPASTAVQTIDVMNKLWGRHPGLRANHAEGVVVEGSFSPTPEAAGLSSAAIFAGKPVPVTVRFSDATGLPDLADGADAANPHGMAIRFRPEGATYVDVVLNSLPYFPVATGEEFAQLLQAASESGPDAPHPTKIEQFIATHPAAAKAGAGVRTPTSFARESYNGVDAFIFVNGKGERQPFRFQFQPVAGGEYLDKDAAAKRAPDFLRAELPERLKAGKAEFRVMAQLANPGDQTKDPTQPWPTDRRMVNLGTLTLTGAVADQAEAQKALRFLPNHLQPGIEVSDDPLIDARVRSYVISFGRRSQ
ncbi:MAG: catalase family peroxidase [Janthinobacterium lividum]